MANHKHAGHGVRYLAMLAALFSPVTVSLAEDPPAPAETGGLVCEPVPETEIHAPGDPHWIGHTMRQLQETLGKERMCLGQPSKNLVLVYHRRGADCLDAYVIDACEVVIKYYCRPLPATPMRWDDRPPASGAR